MAPGRESIDIRTLDGWSLRADVHEPDPRAIGTAVLAHATMGRRGDFDLPAGAGLTAWLVERGWRVVTFDFRGHGDSHAGPPEAHGCRYDDLVMSDLPAVHEFARSRSRRKQPVVLVGHSLGGHTALAAQGAGLVSFDGIVAVAANVWLRELEPSPSRWIAKRATLAAGLAIGRRLGRFPARALRLGSDDEPRGYLEDFERFARTGAWNSADGRVDYLASLARICIPVLQIVSDGDRIACVPACGERFVARCGGPHEVLRIARGDEGDQPPDHLGPVTRVVARGARERMEAWMRRVQPNATTLGRAG